MLYILCHSDVCTEQLLSLCSLADNISAVRYTNVNGIVLYIIYAHTLLWCDSTGFDWINGPGAGQTGGIALKSHRLLG